MVLPVVKSKIWKHFHGKYIFFASFCISLHYWTILFIWKFPGLLHCGLVSSPLDDLCIDIWNPDDRETGYSNVPHDPLPLAPMLFLTVLFLVWKRNCFVNNLYQRYKYDSNTKYNKNSLGIDGPNKVCTGQGYKLMPFSVLCKSLTLLFKSVATFFYLHNIIQKVKIWKSGRCCAAGIIRPG